MSYGFKVMIEGDRACFTNPALKAERATYMVPTPSAMEGLLKSIYWKPAIRYVIDKIIIFNPFEYINIQRNEVKNKISFSAVKNQMQGGDKSPCIYADENRTQRNARILKNVCYGVEFHFELTGLKSEDADEGEDKHFNIIKRRLEKGNYFSAPFLGCAEFGARKIELVEEFDYSKICNEVLEYGDMDLGYMLYALNWADKGLPVNNDWEHPVFSNSATPVFYNPHMVNGIIDVRKYRRELYGN